MGQRFDSLEALHQAATIAKELRLPAKSLDEIRDEAIACLALPDLKPTGRVITRPPAMAVFDPTMTRYAFRFRDGTISVRRVADDQEVARFSARGDRGIEAFRFSPDGRYLATTHQLGQALTVWDVERHAVSLIDPGPVSWGTFRFSPDRKRMILAHEGGEFRLYDLVTGQLEHHWTGSAGAHAVAFRPDGLLIALTSQEGNESTCRIVEAESGRLVRLIPLPILTRSPLDWSPDGSTLAIPCEDRKIYLYDAATGTRRALLEGHINLGLSAAFHPSGALLASGGWEGRTWLWDPVLGRPWLTLTGSFSEFSRDGRIVVHAEDKLTTYQADPAVEYRTFAHAASKQTGYYAPSIRCDGRVLTVGTSQGVMLWDLARGAELAFLPIGLAWHLRFEPSGDLLTSGALGVQRWPIQLDLDRRVFRIGPPRQLPLPPGAGGIGADRSGRIVAKADHKFAFIARPEETIRVGPLDDCRGVAVSPDGEWLATGNHAGGGEVWRLRDATKVKDLSIEGNSWVCFSPNGKWLMAGGRRLWEVGTWREVRTIAGGQCFSPDGRLVVTRDANRVLGLVETETGRTLARLESPDLCDIWGATFNPDGSRLVVTTHDGPAVHVWDLRAIRRHLAKMGLDWDAPSYANADPADPAALPLPPVQVDYGELTASVNRSAGSNPTSSSRTLGDESMAEADVLAYRGEWQKAAAAFARAFGDGAAYSPDRWFEQAILQLAVSDGTGHRVACQRMLNVLQRNNEVLWLEYAAHAWALAPESPAEKMQAVRLAERRSLVVATVWSEHVLGLALYHAGRFAEAEARLRSCVVRNPAWAWQVLNWLVLAMTQERLGRPEEARRWLEQSDRWIASRLAGRPGGTDRAIPENWFWRDGILLHLLHREAHALFRESIPELPAEVFAKPR
jgi:WD40 repeat protein